MKLSEIFITVLLSRLAAGDVFTTAPGCDDTCLLQLIRYREQVNTDWLMALGFYSSLLQHEACRYNYNHNYNHHYAVYAGADIPTQPALLPETTTITSIVIQTSARFTFGEEVEAEPSLLPRHLAPMR